MTRPASHYPDHAPWCPGDGTSSYLYLFARRDTSPRRPFARLSDSPARRALTSSRMATLTGWFGLSARRGTPRLMDSGTSRLDGTYAAIGARMARSRSLLLNPTFE